MRVETIKKITLTEEEQKVIAELYDIFNNDYTLSTEGIWDILTDIAKGSNGLGTDYDYCIEIVD